jgi:hypothetical protein
MPPDHAACMIYQSCRRECEKVVAGCPNGSQ